MVSMPITCLTLGLFIFVINALMLLLVSAIPFLGFVVNGFIVALVGLDPDLARQLGPLDGPAGLTTCA